MRLSVATLGAALCLSASILAGTAGAAACPNEAFRVGPSALLPGCRAYEMVSPVDKSGGSVTDIPVVKTDRSGNVVSYYSTSPFAGAQGIIVFGGYVSNRAGEAWGTKSTEGPQYNEYGLSEYGSPAISEDGTKTFTASRLALAPGAIEGGSNVYVRDNATGADKLVVAQSGSALWENVVNFSGEVYVDGNSDWSKMLLFSRLALTADASTELGGSEKNLYEYDAGGLRLASVLPSGKASPKGGVSLGRGHSVSADGSRVFFTDAPYQSASGVLYVRIDGSRTVAVSRSRIPADKGATTAVNPLFATADGKFVFFRTNVELLPGDKTMEQETIYRYDTYTDELTDVIPDKPTEGARVNGTESLLAAGEDGSLLFRSFAALVPGVEPAEGGDNLYVARDGRIEYVGTTEDGTFTGAASEDGRYFAIQTTTPLVPAEDPSSPACGESERCGDVYVFDADTGTLRCASCAPVEAGGATLGNVSRSPSGPKYVRSMLDDGTVFFSTPSALAPRDVNGVADVYRWNGGTADLVSTGTSASPSIFANTTPDGSSVFFLTSQSLVPQDRDGSQDLYVDREGGGLASQFAGAGIPPCEAESCRGASPPAPAPNASGSAAVGGESSCLAPAAAARRAGAAAHRISRAAKRAAKNDSARRAKGLRRRAKAESGKAKSLRKRAGACRGAGR